MKENRILKWLLIIQSFVPLFFLILIRCADSSVWNLIKIFFQRLFSGDFSALQIAIHHQCIYAAVLTICSAALFLFGVVIILVFWPIQESGFEEVKMHIATSEDTSENSVAFFVTYIIPLVLSDITESNGFWSFIVICVLLLLLMRNTNLYYQNPILAILGYKTFTFQFENEEEKYIAITKGHFDPKQIIKWKIISDNVYLIYNKN